MNEELYGFLGSREKNSSIVFHIGHERDPECHKIELFVVFHIVCINFISVNMVMPLHHTHNIFIYLFFFLRITLTNLSAQMP